VVAVAGQIPDGHFGVGDPGLDQFFDFACVHRHLWLPFDLSPEAHDLSLRAGSCATKQIQLQLTPPAM
jgi:hypothetical protein